MQETKDKQNNFPYYPYMLVKLEDSNDDEGEPIIPPKKHKGSTRDEMEASAFKAAMALREEFPDKEVYVIEHCGNMYLRDYTAKPPSFIPVPENCPRTVIIMRVNGDIDRLD